MPCSSSGVAYGCADTAADKGYGSELTRCGAAESTDVSAAFEAILRILRQASDAVVGKGQ